MIDFVAKKEQKTISDILKPHDNRIKSIIPGKRLFNTYSYKSQMGIMKGHIFCALHCIPAEKLGETLCLNYYILWCVDVIQIKLIDIYLFFKLLDFSIKEHQYYFNVLCTVCRDKDKEIKKKKIFKSLTTQQLFEFRQTAIQVLIKCVDFLTQQEKIKVFRILFDALRNPEITIREKVYNCLKSCDLSLVLEMRMVIQFDKYKMYIFLLILIIFSGRQIIIVLLQLISRSPKSDIIKYTLRFVFIKIISISSRQKILYHINECI